MFKEIVTKGNKLISFTDIELEPYEPYDYYHEHNIKLPEKYGHGLDDLSRNSCDIYLKDDKKKNEELIKKKC